MNFASHQQVLHKNPFSVFASGKGQKHVMDDTLISTVFCKEKSTSKCLDLPHHSEWPKESIYTHTKAAVREGNNPLTSLQ